MMETNQGSRPFSAITRRGAIALVAVLSVGLLVGAGRGAAPRPEGIQVEFSQLNWGGDAKAFRFPQSRVGAVEFSFDSGATELLVEKGAYANIAIQVPGAPGSHWVVRNLYLRFPDEKWMLGSRPSVQFGLPTRNGVRVSRLSYVLSITEEPLASAPAGSPVRTAVGLESYRVGGLIDGGGAVLPLRIGPWQGIKAGKDLVNGQVEDVAWVDIPVADIEEVSEAPEHCAPGAVARSIKYMLDSAGVAYPDSAQEIYNDLKNDMGTTEENGTSADGIVNGKAKYAGDNDLDIDTTLPLGIGGIDDAMDTLNNGGDVEILIRWKNANGEDTGGHVGMIVSIVDNGDGTFQITYIDDPDQTDGQAKNEQHTITVDANGNFPGGRVYGLLIETLNPPAPTPTSSPTPAPGGTMSAGL